MYDKEPQEIHENKEEEKEEEYVDTVDINRTSVVIEEKKTKK